MSNESEVSLAESLNRKLRQFFVALILLWTVLGAFRPIMDNVDLGWHVAQGRWMVEHFAVYRHDVFNYPNLGRPLVGEYFFFQVLLYLAWCLGWWGPSLLAALAYAIIVLSLVRTAKTLDLGASSLPAFAIGLMFLFFQIAFPLRPHLATYFAVILLGTFLLRHRDCTSWTVFWPMALLQIAWANSHSAFVFGPAMVGFFGAEMTLRHWLRDRTIPWQTARTWLAAFLFILLACLVNPFGWTRFYPAFYQNNMESGRAYVGEMQPLGGGLATTYGALTLIAFVVVVLAILFRRGSFSISFLVFAIFFYLEALDIRKAWPVFGLFIPLLVLSTGAFSSSTALQKPTRWLSVIGHGLIAILVAFGLLLELAPAMPTSLRSQWREYDHGRSELSIQAAAWMRAHDVEGRLFHRDEDGGLLQQEGFDHGETFSDTGWGKFDLAFVHEIGVVDERPAALPKYLKAYQPDYIVCSTFCYQWPYYLRKEGWRPIFYSPNSSVWTKPDIRADLSTVPDSEIMKSFDHDIVIYGMPVDTRLYGRNLIALNSYGLEDFAFAKLTSLPQDLHHTPWYWEAARFLCFDQPPFSLAHRNALFAEAQQLHDDALTAEFRAYCLNAAGDTDGALRILEAIPPKWLSNYTAGLLLKIYLDRKRPETLALAQRTDCFDLRNGHHWQYLAEAEEQAGHVDAATHAWQEAVFYYPEDTELMAGATAFAARHPNEALSQAIKESSGTYGH